MVNVKKHLRIPIDVKHFTAEDDTGYSSYGQPTEHLCYMEEEVKTILDESGEEVVSDTTVYFDGASAVERKDLIVLNGTDRRIKSMGKIRAKKGSIVLKVVYL